MSNQDLEHLKLLAIFHYVLGGLIAFYSCFPALYVGFGILIIVAPQTLTGGRGEAPPPAVGWILVVIGVVFVILGWAMAICLVVTTASTMAFSQFGVDSFDWLVGYDKHSSRYKHALKSEVRNRQRIRTRPCRTKTWSI